MSTLEDAFVKASLQYQIKQKKAKVREMEEVIFKALGPDFTYEYLDAKDKLYDLETAHMYVYVTEMAKVILQSDLI